MSRKTCVEVLTFRRCRKKAIEGGDRCIFHDPEEWKHKSELIRKRIAAQVKRGSFDFEGYHFPEINLSDMIKDRQTKGILNFKNAHFHAKAIFRDFQSEWAGIFVGAKFSDTADFMDAKFSDVDFTEAEFLGRAIFMDAKFSDTATFYKARFLDEANFGHASFPDNADFVAAEFLRGAYFILADFSGIAEFLEAEFSDGANFWGTKFSGCAHFREAEFSGEVIFGKVQFLGEAEFRDAKFSDGANFNDSRFLGDVHFINTTFSGNVSLLGVTVDDVSFDFSYSVFRRELFVDEIQWSRKNYRLRIESKDLEGAMRNYHLLKKVFSAMGHYRVAGDLYYNEMVCRRKLLSKSLRKSLSGISGTIKSACTLPPLKYFVKSSFLRWFREIRVVAEALIRLSEQDIRSPDFGRLKRGFWKRFFDWLWMQIFYFSCGFGERPLRVTVLSISTILAFSLAYSLLAPMSIASAVYLSLDSFVALGVIQGTILPRSWRWLTYLEALFGLFMMSLFLVVFTRKMVRD